MCANVLGFCLELTGLPNSDREGNRSVDGGARALGLFPHHILRHRLVQAQLGHQLLQSSVLCLQMLHLAHLIQFQSHVLLLPAVRRLFADRHLANQLRYRTPTSACFTPPRFAPQNTVSSSSAKPSAFSRFGFAKTNISTGSKIPGLISQWCACSFGSEATKIVTHWRHTHGASDFSIGRGACSH